MKMALEKTAMNIPCILCARHNFIYPTYTFISTIVSEDYWNYMLCMQRLLFSFSSDREAYNRLEIRLMLIQ